MTATTDKPYTWEDSDAEAKILLPLDAAIKTKDVTFKLIPTALTLGIKGKAPVIDDTLWGKAKTDDSMWEVETRGGQRTLVVTLIKAPAGAWDFLLKKEDVPPDTTPTHKVFFDVTIDNEPAGRVVFGLYGNVAPKTAENFRALCTGDSGTTAAGVPRHFKGSKFHRIIPGFMVQGGDFTAGNGTGGESIYGEKFPDENFRVPHSKEGLLSMANAGPNTNGSQFFITVAATPHLNKRHCVFGEVLEGYDVVKKLEKVGSAGGTPSKEAVIADCGELPAAAV